jgi:hypothetical protein
MTVALQQRSEIGLMGDFQAALQQLQFDRNFWNWDPFDPESLGADEVSENARHPIESGRGPLIPRSEVGRRNWD